MKEGDRLEAGMTWGQGGRAGVPPLLPLPSGTSTNVNWQLLWRTEWWGVSLSSPVAGEPRLVLVGEGDEDGLPPPPSLAKWCTRVAGAALRPPDDQASLCHHHPELAIMCNALPTPPKGSFLAQQSW